MKKYVKAMVLVLATGAVFQAIVAYASQGQLSVETGSAGMECADLRAKLIALIEKERERERQLGESAMYVDPRVDRAESLLKELEALVVVDKVEPGP